VKQELRNTTWTMIFPRPAFDSWLNIKPDQDRASNKMSSTG